ncbi:MAG: hypothetical protein ACXABY_18390 [Candidatus Thorarchaeota archaeon]|jgi:hypothetical protein
MKHLSFSIVVCYHAAVNTFLYWNPGHFTQPPGAFSGYNLGYQDGKRGHAYDLPDHWTDSDVDSYNEGWRRGYSVWQTWENRLTQGYLFDVV